MRNENPVSVKNAIVIDPLAAVNRALWKRLTSSIGRAMRLSTWTKSARVPRPAAIVTKVGAELQPQFGT